MAGHSHWARIKRAKAVTDKRRSKEWSKLSRAIIVAARAGGGDPDMNLALRYAIDAAKAANMPKDTIERAVKKGSGALEGEDYAEITYEGYGPGGAAVLCTALTDNRNRTAAEIRKIFERRGGSLGASGSVAWMFERRGVFILSASVGEERATELALEVGADDVEVSPDAIEIRCDPAVFGDVRKALEAASAVPESCEITMAPTSSVRLEGELAQRTLKLVEELEEQDDVQNVYSNFEVSDEDMANLAD